MDAIDKIRREYERCLEPTDETLARDLFGMVTQAEKLEYYRHRAEALGFCLDKLEEERRLTASPTPTEIERLCAAADREDGAPGYHVTLKFPDGSFLDAPIYARGPNWASFAELRDTPLTVDTQDAEISINWRPGPATAVGVRFAWLDAAPSPRI